MEHKDFQQKQTQQHQQQKQTPPAATTKNIEPANKNQGVHCYTLCAMTVQEY